MPHKVVITFEVGAVDSEGYLARAHRIGNFHDELFYAFRYSDLGSFPLTALHSPLERCSVTVKSKAKIRRVVSIVQKLADRHFPDGIANVRAEIPVGED